MGILELYARQKRRRLIRKIVLYCSFVGISLLIILTYHYADRIRLIFEPDVRLLKFMAANDRLPALGISSTDLQTPKLLRCKTGKAPLYYKQSFQDSMQILTIFGKRNRIEEITNHFTRERTFRIKGKEIIIIPSGIQAIISPNDSLATLTIVAPIIPENN